MTSPQGNLSLALAEKLKTAVARPNIHGYVPHEKQEEFHASTAQGRIFIGGNRSGKTVSGACELVRAALGIDPHRKFPSPPLRLRAVTVDRKQGIDKIILPELHRWIPKSTLRGGSWDKAYSKDLQTVTFENESFIEILTYEQDIEKHAGVSRHAVWFDEEPPQPIFDEGLGRLVDTNGKWWMTMTPVEGMEFIYDFFQDQENGIDRGIDFINVNNAENPHIEQGAIEALFLGLSAEEREMRTTGQFRQLGKKVYADFDLDRHCISIADFRPEPHWFKINGMDYGWANPTCWLFTYIDPRTMIFYIYDEMYESRVGLEQWAPRLHRREERYGLPLYRVCDPATAQKHGALGGASVHSTYADLGVYMALGNNDLQQGISRVRRLLQEDRLKLIRETTPNLQHEFRRYRYADWANRKVASKNNQQEKPVKKDDHALDTLRYIVNAYLDWGDTPPPIKIDRPPAAAMIPNRPVTVQEWDEEVSQSKSNLTGPLGGIW